MLGIQWLCTLGPLVADFSIPWIVFNYKGNWMQLTGNSQLSVASSHQISRMLKIGSILSLHTITYEPHPSSPTLQTAPTTYTNHDLQALLTKFSHLFQKPTDLPPPRIHDHHIHLLPNSQPINVKPYRYPHYQKEIIAQLISEMLQDGVIKPSQSPYSSPVLLVRKKDGTWRFCVDYRALNAITIRDRFPIPTVEELLDELHGATIFSKIDLHLGYHQIQVKLEDTHKTAFRSRDGHYKFLVMPFGLTNAPSTF